MDLCIVRAFNALRTEHGLKEGIEQRQKLSVVVPSHLGYIYSPMSTGNVSSVHTAVHSSLEKLNMKTKQLTNLGHEHESMKCFPSEFQQKW